MLFNEVKSEIEDQIKNKKLDYFAATTNLLPFDLNIVDIDIYHCIAQLYVYVAYNKAFSN